MQVKKRRNKRDVTDLEYMSFPNTITYKRYGMLFHRNAKKDACGFLGLLTTVNRPLKTVRVETLCIFQSAERLRYMIGSCVIGERTWYVCIEKNPLAEYVHILRPHKVSDVSKDDIIVTDTDNVTVCNLEYTHDRPLLCNLYTSNKRYVYFAKACDDTFTFYVCIDDDRQYMLWIANGNKRLVLRGLRYMKPR